MPKRTLTKAARLLLLYRLQRGGALEGLSLREIGARLDVNASTIMRDLRDLEDMNNALQEWVREWKISQPVGGRDV